MKITACRIAETNKEPYHKTDDFFHGFGISNMRNAAEKYGGQLTTKCESWKISLEDFIADTIKIGDAIKCGFINA